MPNQLYKPISSILIFAIILLSFAWGIPANADTSSVRIPINFQFNKDIGINQTVTPDVSYLQRFLNRNINTQVATSGPGSDNNLSNYFGLKTKDALARFQNIFKDEILTPQGLSTPTGYLGTLTRQKINAILTSYMDLGDSLTARSSSTPSVFVATSTATSSLPTITDASPVDITGENQVISVYGKNFSTSTNILNSNIGTLNASSLYSSSDIRVIKFALNEFSNFNSSKISKAGQTQSIYIRITSDTRIGNEYLVLQYTFPKATSTTEEAASEEPSQELFTGSFSSGSNNSSSVKKSSGSGKLLAILGITAGSLIILKMFGGNLGLTKGMTSTSATTAVIKNFGGKLAENFYCTCSHNNLLTIEDVRHYSVQVMYQPGASRLYKEYNLTSGVNVLGTYTGTGVCMVYSGMSCNNYGSPQGTIISIGTSMGSADTTGTTGTTGQTGTPSTNPTTNPTPDTGGENLPTGNGGITNGSFDLFEGGPSSPTP